MIERQKYPLVFAASAFLVWLIVRFVLRFDGLYGQDAYEYFRYAKALNTFLSEGKPPGDYFWPLYYPILGALLSLFVAPIFALQWISVGSLVLTAIFVHRTICLLYEEKSTSGFYVLVCFVLSPMVLRAGMLVMSDMLATLFVCLSAYSILSFDKKKHLKYFLGFIVFAVSASMTRYVAAVIVWPLGIWGTFKFFKHRKSPWHLFWALLLGFLLILPHWLIRSQSPVAFLKHPALFSWSAANFFRSQFMGTDGTFQFKFINIIYAFGGFYHPAYFVLGALFVLLVLILKQKLNASIYILWISALVYGLFLAGVPYQNMRFLILSFPLIIVCVFPGWQFILEKTPFKKIAFTLFVLLQLSLFAHVMQPLLHRSKLEQAVVAKLSAYQGSTLYSFDMDVALKGRELRFEYKNLWDTLYTQFKVGDFVLFNPMGLKDQWQGKNPMLNWEYLKTNYQMETVEQMPEGWTLFKIISIEN
ncbi:glycosyltransferase family 39 protein [Marinilongibacter aquaticus]|uniref:ArnT family glycosyltransferase n=1 Tax=Marinilongibacter aquaticus TaxID=2975157 RepID=UPI0021BDEDDF|nr:glycosyltransferase family 39 protein [Marinilongibacter aquaticus]UBM59294.1 glycosyltransferase family 39 protein [Marinilongibacter aquaticus]